MAQPQHKTDKPKPTASGKLDRQLAAEAARKRAAGEKPTREENAAIRRIDKAVEEENRWAYYATIPQKHWRTMSGRDRRTIVEQASRYGLPFGGRSIDLSAVVRALHGFLARHSHKLAGVDDDPLMSGNDSPALEQYRKAKAEHAELDLAERRGELMPVDRTREGMAIFAGHIRNATEVLRRQYGPDAQTILEEHINDALRDVLDYFGTLDDPPEWKPNADTKS